MAEIRRWAIVQANSACIWRASASAKACDSKGFQQKTPIKKASGRRESNPHHQLGRLRFYH